MLMTNPNDLSNYRRDTQSLAALTSNQTMSDMNLTIFTILP